ncbi:NADP-dependent isocitrate dehydrogenase [Venenivibrio stagnispumantis]|uniref:Isocitrate dehydrogenase [NADP] n=1 Tax=Venenivibrio stagnispumantis TaxID=407998 RepID=A0AA45WKJ1_9AQUI|nr:NADP-dependent isocitrate dehydrogenase [Venenivibrio stagnispumantis]MCW4573027.1 NADP-dependent isocitrate dehydrogenase [Venenivibrio stagnispumantis]SMP07665.1 isocitrate dehydrogenase [Venenivibrio stagnispumantis]
MATIVWTKIDEAPALATYSLLPIMRAYTKVANLNIELRDISLAGRIIAQFSDTNYLREDQKIPDELAYLGELVLRPEANIMKLPNISASLPQLKEAIAELQSQGYNLPDYPENPQTEEEKDIKARYDRCIGSVVNPVLRQGNSDRRLSRSVKEYAKKHPHKLEPVSENSKSHVAHMVAGDFYENEKSVTIQKDTKIRYEFVDKNGNVQVLKEVEVNAGDVVDGTFLDRAKLRDFYEKVIEDAKDNDILFSLHLKATMMKVSDPVMFGDAIRVYFKELFEKHGKELEEIGFNPNNGLADLENKMKKLPEDKQNAIKQTIAEIYEKRPRMYMVDSDNGITNLHMPNDVIVDASVPAVIKNGLKGWGPKGEVDDCVITIPDRSYARMYKEIVEDIKVNGQFDPTRIGTVQNVGLMAMKAEEYGSHDKTFFPPADGIMRIVDAEGNILIEHQVNAGDIYRSCITKDIAIRDWIKLAINRAKEAKMPIVFWLDRYRAHDRELIKKIKEELPKYDLSDVEWYIKSPEDAMKYTLKRFREGKDTISVTGNVLRDYLTDLFPIIEVGTSARSLSIVPLIAGGGVFETGAGGSAPKHVEQFLKESHLRWDSLGEFLAFVEALKLAYKQDGEKDKRLLILADTLDRAIEKYLENDKTPRRKAGQLDTRGSHFYLAMYWAEALANQKEDEEIAKKFAEVYQKLAENEQKILEEIAATEGKPADIGGWYHPDDVKAEKAMRPSATFNAIIDSI